MEKKFGFCNLIKIITIVIIYYLIVGFKCLATNPSTSLSARLRGSPGVTASSDSQPLDGVTRWPRSAAGMPCGHVKG